MTQAGSTDDDFLEWFRSLAEAEDARELMRLWEEGEPAGEARLEAFMQRMLRASSVFIDGMTELLLDMKQGAVRKKLEHTEVGRRLFRDVDEELLGEARQRGSTTPGFDTLISMMKRLERREREREDSAAVQ